MPSWEEITSSINESSDESATTEVTETTAEEVSVGDFTEDQTNTDTDVEETESELETEEEEYEEDEDGLVELKLKGGNVGKFTKKERDKFAQMHLYAEERIKEVKAFEQKLHETKEQLAEQIHPLMKQASVFNDVLVGLRGGPEEYFDTLDRLSKINPGMPSVNDVVEYVISHKLKLLDMSPEEIELERVLHEKQKVEKEVMTYKQQIEQARLKAEVEDFRKNAIPIFVKALENNGVPTTDKYIRQFASIAMELEANGKQINPNEVAARVAKQMRDDDLSSLSYLKDEDLDKIPYEVIQRLTQRRVAKLQGTQKRPVATKESVSKKPKKPSWVW